MKLEYRIKKYTYISAKRMFVSQYKIFGIWMNIDIRLKGHLRVSQDCYLEKLGDAYLRIKQHESNMSRSRDWMDKSIDVIWSQPK